MITREESLAKIERLKKEWFSAIAEHHMLFGEQTDGTPVGLMRSGESEGKR